MNNVIGRLFSKADHTCPWWLCFTFDNPLRRLVQNPYRLLEGYVKPGDTVLDIGPGMGYFTFPMSEITGTGGKVVALDIQDKMLKRLKKKADLKNTSNVEIKLYDGINFSLEEKFNFVLLFWMYHEVNNKKVFIREIESVIKPGAAILIAEPKIHVNRKKFDESIKILIDAGFSVVYKPKISLSRTALLRKLQ